MSIVSVAPGVVDTQMQVDIREKCKYIKKSLENSKVTNLSKQLAKI